MEEGALLASQIALVAAFVLLTAALIVSAVRRRGSSDAGWLPLLGTVLLLAANAMVATIATGAEPTPLTRWASVSFFVGWPLLAATFPNGRFVPRWSVIPVLAMVGLTVAYLITDGGVTDQPWWVPILDVGMLLFFGLAVYRYLRRLNVAERSRVRWPLLGALLEIEAFAILEIVEGGAIAEQGPLSVALANLAGLPIAVGFALGILNPRRVDVDRILRAVLAATFAAVPLVLAFWGVRVLATALGGSADAAAWSAGIVTAVLAVPLYRLTPRLADRVVYRGRADPVASLRELGRRLDSQLEPAKVPASIVELVSDSLGLDGVELVIGGVSAARIGEPGTPEAEEFPLDYQGEHLGVLRVIPRRAEAALTERDRATLAELARHAAPALHGARSYAELTEARARAVLAREEERKQLRRDLHDDLAPTLVGISLGAAAVAQLARTGAADLDGVAEQLADDIQAALAQTREIAHGLRPPLLDDQGLVATIRQRLRVAETEPPAVTVTAPDGPLTLPAAVELAALRIVQEAVSNVRRHASAAHCSVLLTADTDILFVEVIDDGIGLPSRYRPGFGIASIRERAEELGGRVRVRRGPAGGTRVSVLLPLTPLDEHRFVS